MFLCFLSNGSGGWNTSQVSFATDCAGFVAQSADSYSDFALLFKTYFQFDAALFEQIVGWNLVIFVIGHCVGRVMMVARKS